MTFWWIDWQQGGEEGGCTGLAQNPTIWYALNRVARVSLARAS